MSIENQKQNETNAFKNMLNHKNFKNFLAYSLSGGFFCATVTCLGPLIPYLA